MAKILIAADTGDFLAAWQRAIASRGHATVGASSAAEALQKAAAERPDGVIIEERMAGATELCNELQRVLPPGVSRMTVGADELADPDSLLGRLLSRSSPGRVLLAEDDRQMSAILGMVLAKGGFEVRTVFDGAEVLRELRSFRPHLLVLDIMLPVIDGFHVCQMINEDHTLALRPKIVIISGRGSDWDQNLGTACGAELYLVKPFSNTHFLEQVRELLRGVSPEEQR